MGKKRRRQGEPRAEPYAPPPQIEPPRSQPDDPLGGLSWHDVQTATDVLVLLNQRPDVFGAQPLRGLRAALHPLVMAQIRRYEPVNFTTRVSAALLGKRWHEALRALDGLRDLGEPVKAGTVQRWVRHCDGCPAHLRSKLFQAVLLCGRPSEISIDRGELSNWGEDMVDQPQEAEVEARVTRCAHSDPDDQVKGVEPRRVETSLNTIRTADRASAPQHSPSPPDIISCITGSAPESTMESIHHILFIEPAAERQPPNHYDLHINVSVPHAIAFSPAPTPVARRVVAGVPGAFVLDNVLTREECAAILTLAHSMGFRLDHPVSKSAPSPTYVTLFALDERLASGGPPCVQPVLIAWRSCEWLADSTLLEPIWRRAGPFLPAQIVRAERLGINARWRLFEYTQGGVYRPHIDGSWPAAGLDENGQYVHDRWGASVKSRLTFLIYLNDGFEGGTTTFFMPNTEGGGHPSNVGDALDPNSRELCRHSVTPVAGSVLCFPQSNSASLLHEGSAVLRGKKYVIRTDVMYKVSP